MGKIISLTEYRKKRCLEALMEQIGMPDYCDECGGDIEALILTGQATDAAANTMQLTAAPFPFQGSHSAATTQAPRMRKK